MLKKVVYNERFDFNYITYRGVKGTVVRSTMKSGREYVTALFPGNKLYTIVPSLCHPSDLV